MFNFHFNQKKLKCLCAYVCVVLFIYTCGDEILGVHCFKGTGGWAPQLIC